MDSACLNGLALRRMKLRQEKVNSLIWEHTRSWKLNSPPVVMQLLLSRCCSLMVEDVDMQKEEKSTRFNCSILK